MTTSVTCNHPGCNHPPDEGCGSACILHYDSAEKDATLFNDRLEEKIQHDESDPAVETIDLGGVVFPTEADYAVMMFTKAVTFEDAQFHGVARFRDAQFHGVVFPARADFIGRQFNRRVSFIRAQFHGVAGFWGAQFHGEASFWGAQFHGEAGFRGAQFHGEAGFERAQFHGEASFWGAQFPKGADFTRAGSEGVLDFRDTAFPDKKSDADAVVRFHELTLHSPGNIRFENVDFSRVSFLGTDLSGVPFVGDIKWPLKEEHLKRAVVYDELALEEKKSRGENVEREDIQRIAEEYRQLRINYESSRQEIEAGAFYVGQMEMRRRDTQLSKFYRGLLTVYRIIAMYGESYLRPLLLYFAVALVFAFAYLSGGFEVNGRDVDYRLWPDLGNAGNFFRDYPRGLYYALTAGALLRSEIVTLSWWVPLVQYINMLLDILLLTLTVVALRRSFHR